MDVSAPEPVPQMLEAIETATEQAEPDTKVLENVSETATFEPIEEKIHEPTHKEPSEPVHEVSSQSVRAVTPELISEPTKEISQSVSESVDSLETPDVVQMKVKELQEGGPPKIQNSKVEVSPDKDDKVPAVHEDATSTPEPQIDVKPSLKDDTQEQQMDSSSVDNKDQNESNSEAGDKRSQTDDERHRKFLTFFFVRFIFIIYVGYV